MPNVYIPPSYCAEPNIAQGGAGLLYGALGERRVVGAVRVPSNLPLDV